MKYRLLIFDLDGTIIDAYGAIAESFNFTMRQFGISVQRTARIKRAVGQGDKNLLAPFVPKNAIDRALSIYRKHHQHSLFRKSKLLPYAKGLLRSLDKKGARLAIASNRPTKFSLILLRHLGIESYFDYVLCADKLAFRKPHPLILNTIMRKLKFSKKDTLYIGDMAFDAETGRRAGVKTIIVLGGSSSAREIKKEKPFKIVKNLSCLRGLLMNNLLTGNITKKTFKR